MGVSGRGKSRGTKNWKNKKKICISAQGPGGHGRPRESPDGCWLGTGPAAVFHPTTRAGARGVVGRPAGEQPAST
jgi:hypothetical protein